MKQAYHHKDLRNALIDEALAILASGDAGQITLRELARRLGVTHSAPYAHFPDKRALLEAVEAAGFTRLTELLREAGRPEHDPARRFVAQALAYVQFARDNANLYRLMFADRELAHDPQCDWSPEGDQAFQIVLDDLSALGLPEGTDIRDAACGAWATLHGIAMLEIDGRLQGKIAIPGKAATPNGDAIVLLMCNFLLRGLRAATSGS
ncbi:MAG TPA: WHG domain-containing protein [Candidatus Acidoferrales bacterium]|nr:WHG domain-containing protein [Candidatus Acidoferrales bacterium]